MWAEAGLQSCDLTRARGEGASPRRDAAPEHGVWVGVPGEAVGIQVRNMTQL